MVATKRCYPVRFGYRAPASEDERILVIDPLNRCPLLLSIEITEALGSYAFFPAFGCTSLVITADNARHLVDHDGQIFFCHVAKAGVTTLAQANVIVQRIRRNFARPDIALSSTRRIAGKNARKRAVLAVNTDIHDHEIKDRR
ncbi:hypothetical protein Bpro_4934 (plasmid) [Polaromonas sp. JS666]|nr:hypothetical protein Bpro_4934 [Polaromonas sp. JS666]